MSNVTPTAIKNCFAKNLPRVDPNAYFYTPLKIESITATSVVSAQTTFTVVLSSSETLPNNATIGLASLSTNIKITQATQDTSNPTIYDFTTESNSNLTSQSITELGGFTITAINDKFEVVDSDAQNNQFSVDFNETYNISLNGSETCKTAWEVASGFYQITSINPNTFTITVDFPFDTTLRYTAILWYKTFVWVAPDLKRAEEIYTAFNSKLTANNSNFGIFIIFGDFKNETQGDTVDGVLPSASGGSLTQLMAQQIEILVMMSVNNDNNSENALNLCYGEFLNMIKTVLFGIYPKEYGFSSTFTPIVKSGGVINSTKAKLCFYYGFNVLYYTSTEASAYTLDKSVALTGTSFNVYINDDGSMLS